MWTVTHGKGQTQAMKKSATRSKTTASSDKTRSDKTRSDKTRSDKARSDEATEDTTPSQQIDAIIAALGDWRGEVLARVRTLIKEADPDVVEQIKWKKPSNPGGVPVWSHPHDGKAGIICTGETSKDKVKLTFADGASLNDPSKLFNASLDGNVRRAIDIREHDAINATAFKKLVREAVAFE